MRQSIFHSATLRLTAWYTLTLLFISMLFSIVVFQVSAHELERSFGPPHTRLNDPEFNNLFGGNAFQDWRERRLQEGRSRLLAELVLFNLGVLAAGAAGSYLLARRTLKPVEDALESQARFSSDAAHELRTPLTVMQSEIEVGLRNKTTDKSTYKALLQSNLDEVLHMRALTDRLLMLANHEDIALSPTSLEIIAIEAVNRCIPLAQAKDIAIDNNVGQVDVQADSASLIEAFVILIENAIKYSPSGSTIHLSAATKGRQAIVRVQDNGPGINSSDLPHIFERFYRADKSRSSQNAPGHGLGLAIARQIITAHHGHISAANNTSSTKRKKEKQTPTGATFTVYLQLT